MNPKALPKALSRLTFRPVIGRTIVLPAYAPYGAASVAALATVALMALRVSSNLRWGGAFPFLLCMPAIMLSGWIGGCGPGVFATLICAASAYYWILEPVGSWALHDSSQLLGLGLFLAVGAVISALNEASRRSVVAAARSEQELRATLDRGLEAHAELTRTAEELKRVLEVIPASVWIAKDPQCREIIGNRSAADLLGVPQKQNVSQTPPPGDGAVPVRHFRGDRELSPHELPLQMAAATGSPEPPGELEFELHDGRRITMLGSATPLLDEEGHVRGAVAAFSDITDRKESESALRSSAAWLVGQKEAFQAAVNGVPLETSLGVLIRTAIEQIGHEARCAFYIVDATGSELKHAAGRNEADGQHETGIKIGPDAPGCGLAVHTGKPVITADVTRDPRWRDWLWVAEAYGFRA